MVCRISSYDHVGPQGIRPRHLGMHPLALPVMELSHMDTVDESSEEGSVLPLDLLPDHRDRRAADYQHGSASLEGMVDEMLQFRGSLRSVLQKIGEFVHEDDDVLIRDHIGQSIQCLAEFGHPLRGFPGVSRHGAIHDGRVLLLRAPDEGETYVRFVPAEVIHQRGLADALPAVHRTRLRGPSVPDAIEDTQLFLSSDEHDTIMVFRVYQSIKIMNIFVHDLFS